MPLFRVNRYELTKLSLFGFDIYVNKELFRLTLLELFFKLSTELIIKKLY
jgi:hypothetical protein